MLARDLPRWQSIHPFYGESGHASAIFVSVTARMCQVEVLVLGFIIRASSEISSQGLGLKCPEEDEKVTARRALESDYTLKSKPHLFS